ncbi:SAGA-associated factor 73 [Golovinomyces cichoracearum]|uniref:SAGA-associated factor 73 n=1 Tax=Golovinomyces cichoracearum TaxID=62708 RepID=A0A420HFY6_9PEZI|nr:SAGA-associated factor 73 [Golovinomyces cichoracearum]
MSSKASENDSKTKTTLKKGLHGEKFKSGTIKLKKPAPTHKKPGNWRDGSVIDEQEDNKIDAVSTDISPDSSGPIVNILDDAARETFPTGRPLEDSPDLRRCIICKKIVLKDVSGPHVAACNRLKKQKALRKKEQKEARERERREAEGVANDDYFEEDGDFKNGNGIKLRKKGAGSKTDFIDDKKGKKRKADTDADRGPRLKKKKEEPKPKLPKQRGPVDVERQCGVMKDGVPCARSLTCKSHSMGAKRAVAGRSLPYDFLLAAYQKKNQARQQSKFFKINYYYLSSVSDNLVEAAIDANAPLEDDDMMLGPIDSDEELSTVMQGLSNWNPQPAVLPIVQIPIDRKYMRERLREQLSQATNGFTLNIFKIKIIPEDGEEDAEGERDEIEDETSRKLSFTVGNRKSVGLEIKN